jgi:hypothetical protein
MMRSLRSNSSHLVRKRGYLWNGALLIPVHHKSAEQIQQQVLVSWLVRQAIGVKASNSGGFWYYKINEGIALNPPQTLLRSEGVVTSTIRHRHVLDVKKHSLSFYTIYKRKVYELKNHSVGVHRVETTPCHQQEIYVWCRALTWGRMRACRTSTQVRKRIWHILYGWPITLSCSRTRVETYICDWPTGDMYVTTNAIRDYWMGAKLRWRCNISKTTGRSLFPLTFNCE